MRLRGLCPCPVLVKSFEEHSRGTSFDEALQNFYWLFVNVARLNGMDREAELAALGAKPPKNPYPNIEAARQGLHQDPLYRWLKRKLPQTIPHARAPTDSPSTESRFVLNLLSLLIQLARPKSRKAPHKRPDKHRATLAKSVARLERGLVDGTIRPTVAKRALLGQLKTELTTKRAKLVPHPALLLIARELAWRGQKEPKLLLEIARLAGITSFHERSAQRYARLAVQVATGRLRTDWHLLDVLERDYHDRLEARARALTAPLT